MIFHSYVSLPEAIPSTVGDGLQLVLPWFASSSRDNLARFASTGPWVTDQDVACYLSFPIS